MHPSEHTRPKPASHPSPYHDLLPPSLSGCTRQVPPFPRQVAVAEDEVMRRLERLIEIVGLKEGMREEEGEGTDEEGDEEGGGEHDRRLRGTVDGRW